MNFLYLHFFLPHNFNREREEENGSNKITPEELEQVAKRANDTRHALESIHNNLCNQIDYICFQWTGVSNQNFVQMFNNAKIIRIHSYNALVVEEELKRIAEKIRVADNEDATY